MFSLLKDMSLVPKGLRYKTMIAFSLMSLIPLLICVWIVTSYIFPNINLFLGLSIGNISLILAICIFISILGLYITKEMIDPVIKIAGDVKGIANGDVDKIIDVSREDEIGDLSTSLNIMTQKIKDNLEELKAYSEKTKLINMEINKKVVALSSLLQIGNLISSTSELEAIMDFISQKLSDVEDNAISFVMLLDDESNKLKVISSCNIDRETLSKLEIKEELMREVVAVDKKTPSKKGILDRLIMELGVKNMIVLPIVVAGKRYGVLALGNNKEEYVFKEDEKELLKVFVKQASMAVENDLLIRKARQLAIKDELTGLYNESYIHTRLDEEIKRAIMYQRPCGYLLIDIDDFEKYREVNGEIKTQMVLRALGEILKASVTDVDKVARLSEDRFSIVLPERNKKQAANIAEDIRKKVQDNLGKIMKTSGRLTVSIGVSENPIDGSSADELMQKAVSLLRNAKSLGKNRVAV